MNKIDNIIMTIKSMLNNYIKTINTVHQDTISNFWNDSFKKEINIDELNDLFQELLDENEFLNSKYFFKKLNINENKNISLIELMGKYGNNDIIQTIIEKINQNEILLDTNELKELKLFYSIVDLRTKQSMAANMGYKIIDLDEKILTSIFKKFKLKDIHHELTYHHSELTKST